MLIVPVTDGIRHPLLVVVLNVEHGSGADLPVIGETRGLARLLARLGKDRKEDPGQNGNDGDHDEQFDERKGRSARHGSPPLGAGFAAAEPRSCICGASRRG